MTWRGGYRGMSLNFLLNFRCSIKNRQEESRGASSQEMHLRATHHPWTAWAMSWVEDTDHKTALPWGGMRRIKAGARHPDNIWAVSNTDQDTPDTGVGRIRAVLPMTAQSVPSGLTHSTQKSWAFSSKGGESYRDFHPLSLGEGDSKGLRAWHWYIIKKGWFKL